MGKYSKGRKENSRQEAVNYNVITEQPRSKKSEAIDPLLLEESEKGDWKYSFFSCCDEMSLCWQAAFCCGKVQRSIGASLGPDAFNRKESCIKCPCVFCLTTCMRRQQIRQIFDIDGNCCLDCVLAFWCNCCALVQIKRQVRDRKEIKKPKVVNVNVNVKWRNTARISTANFWKFPNREFPISTMKICCTFSVTMRIWTSKSHFNSHIICVRKMLDKRSAQTAKWPAYHKRSTESLTVNSCWFGILCNIFAKLGQIQCGPKPI